MDEDMKVESELAEVEVVMEDGVSKGDEAMGEDEAAEEEEGKANEEGEGGEEEEEEEGADEDDETSSGGSIFRRDTSFFFFFGSVSRRVGRGKGHWTMRAKTTTRYDPFGGSYGTE